MPSADKFERGYENNVSSIINVMDAPYNAKGDGATNDTAAIQNALNYVGANNLTLLIPKGFTFMLDGVSLTGGKNFKIMGEGLLKKIPNGRQIPLLKLTSCNNFIVETWNSDGNIINNGNTILQGASSLAFLSCTDFHVGAVMDHNPGFDTVYCSAGSTTQGCDRFTIDSIHSVSDSYTGRNALSVTCGRDFVIGKVVSINTGYGTSPGGVDLETNQSTDYIINGCVNWADVITNGSEGIGIDSVRGGTVDNITINAFVNRVGNTSNAAVYIFGATDVKGTFIGECSGSQLCYGLYVDNSSRLDIYLDFQNSNGLSLGTGGLGVSDIKLRGFSDNQNNGYCLRIGALKNFLIDMTLRNPANYVVYRMSIGTTSNGIFRGDYSKATNGAGCFYSSARAAVSNWVCDSLNMSGWGTATVVENTAGSFSGATSGIPNLAANNCPGYNFGINAPTSNAYAIGTIVKNIAPTTTDNVDHWFCVKGGSPGSWNAVGIGTGTTAQRPALGVNDAGYLYYDTTIPKLMYWNGSSFN